jgi:hypothetical protein
MDPDWVARGLALGGLAVGLVAATIAILNYRRDRPRLRLRYEWGATRDTADCFRIVVVNEGYRPVKIAKVEVVTGSSRQRARLLPRLQFWVGAGGGLKSWRARLGPRWLRLLYGSYPPPSSKAVSGPSSLPLLLDSGESEHFDFRGHVFHFFANAAVNGRPDRRMYASVTDVTGRETVRRISKGGVDAILRLGRQDLTQSGRRA